MCILQNMYEDVHWVWLQTEKWLISKRIYGTMEMIKSVVFPLIWSVPTDVTNSLLLHWWQTKKKWSLKYVLKKIKRNGGTSKKFYHANDTKPRIETSFERKRIFARMRLDWSLNSSREL